MDEMNPIKVHNFLNEHGDVTFPPYRTLNHSACHLLRHRLASRFSLTTDEATLAFLKDLSNNVERVSNINAQQSGFRLDEQIGKLGIVPGSDVFLNWHRFDDVDQLKLADLTRWFHDIWYPLADDIDLCDETGDWIFSIRSEGEIFYRIAKDASGPLI